MTNHDNPYAAPQTIDLREVPPAAPPGRPLFENRDYRWLKRGLVSLALALSPLTLAVLWEFEEFAVLGLSVILPFCCGTLAVVPPRTPGRVALILAALAQAVGSFCLFVLVLTLRDGADSRQRFEALVRIAGVAEIFFYVSLLVALIRLGRWLQDPWLCRLSYGSLSCSGVYFLTLLLERKIVSIWNGRELTNAALLSSVVLAYLTFFAALLAGLRIPRLIALRIPEPPRFESQ